MTSEQAQHAAAVLRRVAPTETHEGRRACLDAAGTLEQLAETAEAIAAAVAEATPKICPETGAPCEHGETCTGFYAGVSGSCWLRHCRRASEPESRNTGLHRDSMG